MGQNIDLLEELLPVLRKEAIKQIVQQKNDSPEYYQALFELKGATMSVQEKQEINLKFQHALIKKQKASAKKVKSKFNIAEAKKQEVLANDLADAKAKINVSQKTKLERVGVLIACEQEMLAELRKFTFAKEINGVRNELRIMQVKADLEQLKEQEKAIQGIKKKAKVIKASFAKNKHKAILETMVRYVSLLKKTAFSTNPKDNADAIELYSASLDTYNLIVEIEAKRDFIETFSRRGVQIQIN